MATTQTTKACVLHGIKDLRIEQREVPPLGPDELQLAVCATGLCGSDLHYYHQYRNGDILVREPLALGHESAGVVLAVGDAVPKDVFKVGDRVAIEVGIPCGKCARCTEGAYNICKEMRFRSSAKSFPHFQGTLQGVINQPAAWCHKLPENVSLEEGALLEPMSVAIHAVRRSKIPAGSTCLVLGAGAVGLLTAAMLVAHGAETVVISDIDARRVSFAVDNGFADRGVVMPRRSGSTVDEKLEIARDAASLMGQQCHRGTETPIGEFDAVFECTGVEPCMQAAIYASRPGGRVLIIGMGTPIQTLPISAAALREVDLIGVFRYASTYEYGIDLLSGKVDVQLAGGRPLPDVKKLVTHRFKNLEAAREAFEMAGKPADQDGNLVLKVMIQSDSH
ncbi:hypothetical protein VTO42DRAFT_2275 [Malbranchea cinnamomea]